MKNDKEPLSTSSDRDYLEVLLTEKQAAAFLGFAPRTLQKWRVTGGGPVFAGISTRAVRYKRKDLIAWVNAHRKHSTSDTGPIVEA